MTGLLHGSLSGRQIRLHINEKRVIRGRENGGNTTLRFCNILKSLMKMGRLFTFNLP
ncbi:MAG: hypothetical protein M9924_17515 [Rhizobiaceae bacterium]|nr:hypothetical protein [Rhizobiaceae bacterium]